MTSAFVTSSPSSSFASVHRYFPVTPRRRSSCCLSMSSASSSSEASSTSPTSPTHPTAAPTTTWARAAISQHACAIPPHASSHFIQRRPRAPFFEGWYLRLTLPSSRSYAFMFSVESSGPCTAQLLCANDVLHMRELSPKPDGFYSQRRRLAVGHWGYASAAAGQPRVLSGEAFDNAVMQGWQLTDDGSHGRYTADGGGVVQWGFDFAPTLGWGRRGGGCCTATWLSRLPMFDPGYQVLMAHGIVSGGYIMVGGERVDVNGAVAYCEKTWGSAFPRRWWWIQAAVFEDVWDLTVTALGSTRQVLWFEEFIGIIAVHYEGNFFEFSNWNCTTLDWSVSPWGRWRASSTARTGHVAELEAWTTEPPVEVLGPSSCGMVFNVRDNARGRLRLTLRDAEGKAILDGVETSCAQVEVGGERWEVDWDARVRAMPQPLRAFINAFPRGAETSP